MLSARERELVSSELIHRLQPLSLRARLVVEGFMTGLHKSPYHGFSVEFAEHRMYQPGDPLKHVDWKVLGRTDRYYIKQYQEETNLRAQIMLDVSGSMNFAHDKRPTKLEYGRSLAAALVYLLLGQRDAVGLGIFDETLREHYPPRSALTWRDMLWSALEHAEPGGTTAIGNVLHELAEQAGRRGLIILISDLLDEPEKILSGLHHFRHNGHEVLVFQVLDPREIDFAFDREARFEELESNRSLVASPWQIREDYQGEMGAFLESIKAGCARHRVNRHLLTTETPLEDALIAFLTQRQRRM
ncbi:DUF58 domain-containing protein [bacterium]|nr:DUF58 domain-containing protein [bacterium]